MKKALSLSQFLWYELSFFTINKNLFKSLTLNLDVFTVKFTAWNLLPFSLIGF